MDSQNLKQRTVVGDDTAVKTDDVVNNKGRRKVTKRGITSLALSITVPLTLTVSAIYLSSSGNSYAKATASKPPIWFPPVWALHISAAASAVMMGLSAWLVWAKGGFHASPTALYLYLAQLALALVWDPVVIGSGSSRVGLAVCMGMLGSLVGCYKAFKEVNPLAAQVVKPCLAWTAFLALINLTIVYL